MEAVAQIEAACAEKKKNTPWKNKRKRKGKGDDNDDEDDDDFFNPYKKAVPLPGQQAFCEECNSRFTVTPYSKSGPDGEGLLCTSCGKKVASKDSKQPPKKKARARSNRKAAATRMLDGQKYGAKSLQDMCIDLIGQHIEDVEDFGDIGQINMDKICMIISRNRSLKSNTFPLFLNDPELESLNLYDCAKLENADFIKLPDMLPNLRHLNLVYCAMLMDPVILDIASRLTRITSLHLVGAFNLRKTAFIDMFKALGSKLEHFTIGSTMRFDVDCINAMVDNCPNLVSLKLDGITKFNDECLRLLTSLTDLKSLELIGEYTLSDKAIADVLNSFGSNLHTLTLHHINGITEETTEAISACCGNLKHLSLEKCTSISSEGILDLFTHWRRNPGLITLDISRIDTLTDGAFNSIIAHSGHRLEVLKINGCRLLTLEGLNALINDEYNVKKLTQLNVGFVRTVTDEWLEEVSKRNEGLQEVWAWGCTKLTECLKVPRQVRVLGRESDILI